MIRAAQPETVCAYDVLIDDHVVASVTDNYLRKRVHRLPTAVRGRRLRLLVTSTHGANHARVFEIRAYGHQ